MAVDTQTKRMAVSQLGEGETFLPLPDGSIQQNDRYLFLGLYDLVESESSAGTIWWFIYT